MITRAPEKRPEAPTPATARPMIRTAELEDNAHIKDPPSKAKRNVRYEAFKENC